jgi:hypothetical protein
MFAGAQHSTGLLCGTTTIFILFSLLPWFSTSATQRAGLTFLFLVHALTGGVARASRVDWARMLEIATAKTQQGIPLPFTSRHKHLHFLDWSSPRTSPLIAQDLSTVSRRCPSVMNLSSGASDSRSFCFLMFSSIIRSPQCNRASKFLLDDRITVAPLDDH